MRSRPVVSVADVWKGRKLVIRKSNDDRVVSGRATNTRRNVMVRNGRQNVPNYCAYVIVAADSRSSRRIALIRDATIWGGGARVVHGGTFEPDPLALRTVLPFSRIATTNVWTIKLRPLTTRVNCFRIYFRRRRATFELVRNAKRTTEKALLSRLSFRRIEWI